MNATISYVNPQPRKWKDDCWFISGAFVDHSGWSIAVKPQKYDEVLTALENLVDKPSDYELEAKHDYEGQKQWKLVSYPGKPEKQGFGGKGGGFGSGYKQSFEALWYEQERMDRRTALMQAVEFMGDMQPGVEELADRFYSWLRATEKRPAAPNVPNPAPAPQAPQTAPPGRTSTADRVAEYQARTGDKAINNTGVECPACGCFPGKPHFKGCEY